MIFAITWSQSAYMTAGWEHGDGISRVIEERACENFRGQLEKKWHFQGAQEKNSCGISIGFWPWNFQACKGLQNSEVRASGFLQAEFLRRVKRKI